MKVNIKQIKGAIVKDTDVYTLEDNNVLENLTLSKTILKAEQSTRGHSHEDQEEVYFFTKGYGRMELGGSTFSVKEDVVVLIPKGKFHKVMNSNPIGTLEFVCVFERYDRNGDMAKYNKQAEMNKDRQFVIDQYNRNRLHEDMIQNENEINSEDPQDNAPFAD